MASYYPGHICGLYYVDSFQKDIYMPGKRKYLPQVSVSVRTNILSCVSRTTLTQTFFSPASSDVIPELRYTFPLYDGVSVVGFTCTINNDRVIRGIVQEKHQAKQTYNEAVARGQTAGLLEQLPNASDVFTTTVGNVPAGAEVKVDIEYLGELVHDLEVDGIRFTIPTTIAPRYGSYPGEILAKPTNVSTKEGIQITIDAQMPEGIAIKALQSPSHPIAVTIGAISTSAKDADPALHLASATLSLGTAELDKDFVLQVKATKISDPVAILETHPTIPNQRALMATLVPKFNLPSGRPEIVFVCDRSGSMDGDKITNLKSALRLFLKSMPVGVKFNICSFGSSYSFLFSKSTTYDATSVDEAMRHVDTFDSNFGGTELAQPIAETFKQRYKDMDLDVFVLTDGQVWNQDDVFAMVNNEVRESNGSIRLFTLGVGASVSHALIQGLARAGNGFAQAVGENERMDTKVVRMLKASLLPHVNDYTLDVVYEGESAASGSDDDFELVESVTEIMGTVGISEPKEGATQQSEQKPISLFDPNAEPDVDMKDVTAQAVSDNTGTDRYAHVLSVLPPKILQTPFEIAPLFPFNRTTVYLLLSPESTQKNPKYVVLHGISKQGPLKIEIPVSMPTIGQTIHQLAARKAVHELEEGRGWIFHAKSKDIADGDELLKEKYEGRFSDMVEREAVRLGVQFQVGGKWCSFVAVDQNDGETRETEQPTREAGKRHGPALHAPPRFKRAEMIKPRGGGLASSAYSVPAAGPALAGYQTQLMLLEQQNKKRLKMTNQGGYTFANFVPASGICDSMAEFSSPFVSPDVVGAVFSSYSCMSTSEGAGEHEDEDKEMTENETPLQVLVRLHKFDGSWTWSKELARALGLVEDAARDDVAATLLVVAFLRKKLGDERDVWNMMAEKAVAWLGAYGKIGGAEKVEEAIVKNESLF